MAAIPASMAELESLITNTASPIVESAAQSPAESTAQAARTEEVQRELMEQIESVQETLILQMLEKIESVQETLISQLAEAATSSRTEATDVKIGFDRLVEQVRNKIASSQTYNQQMLDVANGSIGMLQAKVELHSTQYGALAASIETKINDVRAILAVAQQDGARQRTDDGIAGAHAQPDSDNGPPNYQLHTPPRERSGGDRRGLRVHKLSLDKLGLKVLSDESKYRTWVKSVDMAMDDIWVGLEDVLRLVKSRPEPMSAGEFGTKLDECRLRPPDCPHYEWTYGFIGRYMYSVLFNITSGEMRSIVKQCEKHRDVIEAYRLLSIHCGPTSFNTSNM